MAKILVTGGQGQLGQSIQKIKADFPQHSIISLKRSELDILNVDQIVQQFQHHKPDVIIHAAAYTAVDMAESDKEKCFEINVLGTENIAKATQDIGALLVYISSDYVYHATGEHYIAESEKTNAVGVYAKSKLYGEWQALSCCEKTVIVRTAWVYSEFGHNFLMTMSRLIKAGKDLKVVDDQVGTPTYAPHLAEALLRLVEQENLDKPCVHEIYNYADGEALTWYDFAQRIRDYLGLENNINPCTTAEYGAAAARPENSRLDSTRITNLLGLTQHILNTGIDWSLRGTK